CDLLELPFDLDEKLTMLKEIYQLAQQFQIQRLIDIYEIVKVLGIKYLDNICESVESSFQFDMLQAFNDKESMDLEFIFRDKVIYAHSLIVCTRCPYFHAFLTRWSKTKRIEMKDVRPEIWLILLKHLYTAISNVNHQNAIELAVAASHYFVSDLKEP